MEHTTTDARKLEQVVKGFANHRRIEMMRLLEQQQELTLVEICRTLRVGIKGGSEHMRKLALAGLVAKRHQGRWVRHRLTPRAKAVLSFLRTVE